MISRRRILLGLAGCMAAFELRRVQAQERIRRVAFIGSTTRAAAGHLLEALIAGMREHGWNEGRNLALDVRYADGDPARYAPIAAELLALRPEVVVTGTDAVAQSVASLTKSHPIVFCLGFDAVGLGLVRTLARPSANVTGLSILAFELVVKRVALLKQAVPRLERLGVLAREGDTNTERWISPLTAEVRKIGVTPTPAWVKQADDLPATFDRIVGEGAQALLEMPEPLFFQHRQHVADLTLRHRLPTAFTTAEHVDAGLMMAYAVNLAAAFRRAATLVDKILKGANPATMPVEQANVYELHLNLRTAKSLGLAIPRSLLVQAARVIE